MRIEGRILPVLVAVGSIGLLQYHSIAFWNEHVGATGLVWSLLLELVSLWLWYSPTLGKRSLGVLTSILLLCGPMYQVTRPLFVEGVFEQQAVLSQQANIRSLQSEIQTLETSLASYRQNAEKRSGWLGMIEKTQADLTAKQEALRNLTNERHTAELNWQVQMVILIQATALFLFLWVSVLAITHLSKLARQSAKEEGEGVPLPSPSGPSHTWNPLQRGDSKVLSEALVQMTPSASGAKGAPAVMETPAGLETPVETPVSSRKAPAQLSDYKDIMAANRGGSTEGDSTPVSMETPVETPVSSPMETPVSASTLTEAASRDLFGKDNDDSALTVAEAEEINTRLDTLLMHMQLSRRSFGLHYNFNSRDLSMLNNYRKLRQERGRVPSDQVLHRLSSKIKELEKQHALH